MNHPRTCCVHIFLGILLLPLGCLRARQKQGEANAYVSMGGPVSEPTSQPEKDSQTSGGTSSWSSLCLAQHS